MDFNKGHYEVLGLEAHAPASQIERAYRFVKQIYSDPVLAAQMAGPDELERHRARIDEAYRVLSDPATRRAYDITSATSASESRGTVPQPLPHSNGGERRKGGVLNQHEGIAAPEEPRKAKRPRREKSARTTITSATSASESRGTVPQPLPHSSVSERRKGWRTKKNGRVAETPMAVVEVRPPAPPLRPAPPVPPPEGPFDGAVLRNYRIARGVSLDQIADETKVRRHYLENIEADRFDAFPAALYLKGYLQAYCRALGLDCRAVAESYMARVTFEPPAFRLPGTSFFS